MEKNISSEEKPHPLKVVLIGVNASFNHTNLAIRYLERYCRETLGDKEILIGCQEFTINETARECMEALLELKADIYGFSCYIWNISLVLEMTEILKKLNPSCILVLGGPEISFEDESFFYRHPEIDYLIQGPGEKAFAELVFAVEMHCGSAFRRIAGEAVPLREIPFVYKVEDFSDKQKQYYYETSRGCPFHCSYCLSSSLTGMDLLPMERIREELVFFIRQKICLLKLVDRTFNFDDRRAMEIWRFLIEKYRGDPFHTRFHFEIAADLLSEEALSLLSEAPQGLFQFEIGVQTTNRSVLETIRRKTSFEKITHHVARIKKTGNIAVHLDLIAGLPTEDWRSFAKSFNDVFALRPDMLQLGFLKVLKGSPIRKETEKFHLIYPDRPPYEIAATESMSFHELNRLKHIEDLLEKYYNSSLFRYSLEFIIELFSDPFEFFSCLEEEWSKKGLFRRLLSRQQIIREFHTFGIDRIASMKDGRRTGKEEGKRESANEIANRTAMLFSDLVKFDYYRFDKKGNLEELGFNFSHHHPSLPRALEKDAWYGPSGQPVCSKPRLERYSFDAEQMLRSGRIISGTSYVLYEMNGDRPRQVDVLVMVDSME